MDEEQQSKKKYLLLGIAIVLLALIAIMLWFFLGRGDGEGAGPRSALFGNLGIDSSRSESTGTAPNSSGGDTGFGTPSGDAAEHPILRRISSFPSVGAAEYIVGVDVSKIRYMEAEKGNVYDIDLETNREERVTNTTVPHVHEALFGVGGRVVVTRFEDSLGTIKTQVRDILPPIETAATDSPTAVSEGDFLEDNITDVSISPDRNSLFYIIRGPSYDSKGGIVDLRSRASRNFFSSPFSEWMPQLLNDGTLRMTTKASGLVSGYSYTYSEGTKSLRRILGPKSGLAVNFSPTGKRYVYSERIRDTLVSGFGGMDTSPDEDHPAVMEFAALAEKCAWTRSGIRVYCGSGDTTRLGLLPDNWYKGTAQFSDSVWSFDFGTGLSEKVAALEEGAHTAIDMIDPFVTSDGKTLIFRNKRDGYLWALSLPTEYSSTSVTETTTEPLTPEELKDAAGSAPPLTP